MCRTIHKIALITNLTQSLVDIELKYDSTTDKPMYRERGADTWLPFSSGITVSLNADAYNRTDFRNDFTITKASSYFALDFCMQSNSATMPSSISVKKNDITLSNPTVLYDRYTAYNRQLNHGILLYNEPVAVNDVISVEILFPATFGYGFSSILL